MTRALAGPVLGPVLGPALALFLLAGCGSADRGTGDEAGKKPTSPSTTVCVRTGQPIGEADLDGDGTREELNVMRHGGEGCPPGLGVTGSDHVGAELASGEPPIRSGFGVTVPGRKGELFVTRQDHPRGGFQLRVYALGDGKLVELETDGHALVPFVALDVQEHPLSIDCTDGGVVITEAVAHEPPGVMFTWDIRRTPYVVDGTEVTAGKTEEIADNVLQGQLGAKYPDLVKYAAFKSCRSGS